MPPSKELCHSSAKILWCLPLKMSKFIKMVYKALHMWTLLILIALSLDTTSFLFWTPLDTKAMPHLIMLESFQFFEFTRLSHFLAFAHAVSSPRNNLSFPPLSLLFIILMHIYLSCWFQVQITFFQGSSMPLTSGLAVPVSSYKTPVSVMGAFNVLYFHFFSYNKTRRFARQETTSIYSLLYRRYPVSCLPHSQCLQNQV